MIIQTGSPIQKQISPAVPIIQVDPNIELMKKQEAEKLRLQKEALEKQQAEAKRQQAEAMKKQQEDLKKQQEAFQKQQQEQLAQQAKMLEQQKMQMQLEHQKQMAAQQEALKAQQEKLKKEQDQQAKAASIAQQKSNVQIKTSIFENQIKAATPTTAGGPNAEALKNQQEQLKKQQEELQKQLLEFEKQKAGLIAAAAVSTTTAVTTVTTTSTSTTTHPSYIRPPIGQQPLTSVLQTSDMDIDPLMYNWRTRERQWEIEELDREKQLELERERATKFAKLQREKARKENEQVLKDIEASLFGLNHPKLMNNDSSSTKKKVSEGNSSKTSSVTSQANNEVTGKPPSKSVSSHHQPSGKSDKVLEIANKACFRFLFLKCYYHKRHYPNFKILLVMYREPLYVVLTNTGLIWPKLYRVCKC